MDASIPVKAEWCHVTSEIGTANGTGDLRHCFACNEELRTFFGVKDHRELNSVIGYARASLGLYLCEGCNAIRVDTFNSRKT